MTRDGVTRLTRRWFVLVQRWFCSADGVGELQRVDVRDDGVM